MEAMPSRLALFCEKLLEASWLAVLILLPLFFDPYTNRIFELDKAAILRSLALLMSATWVVKFLEGLGSGSDTEGTLRARLPAMLAANPLALPALLLAVIHLLATALSVAPSISFFGSYNRAQGFYTTLSYLVLFFVAASHLRTRAQFERALSVMIVTSTPIALYAMLQHFGLDPLTWGSEFRGRTTAHLGNPIFLAAYLIMVLSLTLARWMQRITRTTEGMSPHLRVPWAAAAILVLVALIGLGLWKFWALVIGILVLLSVASLFTFLAGKRRKEFLSLTTYTIVLAGQFIAIGFTQSRGPLLGLIIGLFAFAVLWALVRSARRAVLAWNAVGLAAILLGLLVLASPPSWLPEVLKNAPYVARFRNVLTEATTQTGSLGARELIWQGAFRLFTAQAPIWSPIRGNDRFHRLRPLIGYGPETLGLVYPQVKPQELAQELHYRDLNWDRAHNWTLDLLATTGLTGLASYFLLFTAIFYYALKWLGLIRTPGERSLFLVLWSIGGLTSSLGLGWWRGWHLVGLALPVGLLAGFFLYLLLRAIGPSRGAAQPSSHAPGRSLWLVALLAAFVMHFIEIQFGIATVSTQTQFWFYVALLVALGSRCWDEQERPTVASTDTTSPSLSFWVAVASLLLITLSFEFLRFGTTVASFLTAFTVFYGMVFGFVGVWAGFLMSEERTSKPALFHQGISVLAIPLLGIGLGVAMVTTNVAMARADIFYKQAVSAYLAKAWEQSIRFVQSAIILRPSQDLYRALLGLAILETVPQIAEPSSREVLLRAGEQTFLAAQRLNPFSATYAAQLAKLHWIWSQLSTDRVQQHEHIQRAIKHLQVAVRLHPTQVPLRNSLSQLYYELGELELMRKRLQQSVRLDPDYPPTYVYLGNYYQAQGDLRRAIQQYRKARAVATKNRQRAYQFLLKAAAHQQQGELELALQTAQRALGLARDSEKPPLQAYITLLQQQIDRKK